MILSEVLTFVSGIVAGLMTNLLWSRRLRLRAFLTDPRGTKFEVLGFDPAEVNLFPVNRWSTKRPLNRRHISMSLSADRPPQSWFDADEWQGLVSELAATKAGDICYFVDAEVDHRESSYGQIFRYKVAPADYSEHLATVTCLERHPEIRSRIRAMMAEGRIMEFMRTAPPSAVKINVAVVSVDEHFLAVQRAGVVEFKKGLWTVGPNEMMQFPRSTVPGSPGENLFDLAERCLREELNLEPYDYGDINISWLGYDVASAQIKVFAQVKTHLAKRDVQERISHAQSLYEAQDFAWLKLSRPVVTDIITRWDGGDSNGRRWSASAPVSLQELWRVRGLLELRSNG